MGTSPPVADQSLGAFMMRLRDPKTGQPLPDDRLLPHIGMICKLHTPSLSLSEQFGSVRLAACRVHPSSLYHVSLASKHYCTCLLSARSSLCFADLAGMDTTAHTMGWALCVSPHPLCLQFHPSHRPPLT